MTKLITMAVITVAVFMGPIVYFTWPFDEECKNCVKGFGPVPLAELKHLQHIQKGMGK